MFPARAGNGLEQSIGIVVYCDHMMSAGGMLRFSPNFEEIRRF
jgi:hypothetical protein